MAIKHLQELLDDPWNKDRPWSETERFLERQCLDYFARQRERIEALGIQCDKRHVSKEPSSIEELVGALFSHSSYKSYPEKWLRDGAWDKMNGWLARLSAKRPTCDVSGVATLDDWLEALKSDGIVCTHTSGTTGKPSLFPRTDGEVHRLAHSIERGVSDFYPIRRGERRPVFLLGFPTGYNVFVLGFNLVAKSFGNAEHVYFMFPGKLSAEQARQMAIAKHRNARGEMTPDERKLFLDQQTQQQQQVGQAVKMFVENMAKHKGEKIFWTGGPAQAFIVARLGLTMGLEGLFGKGSIFVSSGGLKGAAVPPDWRESIMRFSGISADHWPDVYGMTECNSFAVECPEHKNKHIQPWLCPLVLDKDAEKPAPRGADGKVTGRWAFVDLLAENYWGGIVTGDKVTVDYSGCPCGRPGPVIVGDIARYADVEGIDADKLSCMAQLNEYLSTEDVLSA